MNNKSKQIRLLLLTSLPSEMSVADVDELAQQIDRIIDQREECEHLHVIDGLICEHCDAPIRTDVG